MEVFALAGAPRPLQTLGVNSTWPQSVRQIRLYRIVFQIQGHRYSGEPTLSFLSVFFLNLSSKGTQLSPVGPLCALGEIAKAAESRLGKREVRIRPNVRSDT